jgi:hypothetical protein
MIATEVDEAVRVEEIRWTLRPPTVEPERDARDLVDLLVMRTREVAGARGHADINHEMVMLAVEMIAELKNELKAANRRIVSLIEENRALGEGRAR